VSAPTFESDKDILVQVGSTVCHIIVEFNNTMTTNVGTAYFIDPDHLVTAGHNLKRQDGNAIKKVFMRSPLVSHTSTMTNCLRASIPDSNVPSSPIYTQVLMGPISRSSVSRRDTKVLPPLKS